jgi:hypothetical protein
VALNTTEAEFITVIEASKGLLRLKRLAFELSFEHDNMCCFVTTKVSFT